MLGIKQIFRKGEPTGTCPLCDVAYNRVKRDLRADCFDASYVITAWTLLCPECGYFLILPGTAKIRPASSVAKTESARDVAVSVTAPKLDGELKTNEKTVGVTGTPETGEKEAAVPGEDASETCKDTIQELPDAQAVPENSSVSELAGGHMDKLSDKTEEEPLDQTIGDPVTDESKASAPIKPVDKDAGTDNGQKPADKQETSGSKAPDETEPIRDDKAEREDIDNAKPVQVEIQKSTEVPRDMPKDASRDKNPAADHKPKTDEKHNGGTGAKQTKSEMKSATSKAGGKDERQEKRDKPKADRQTAEKKAPVPQSKVQSQAQPSPKMTSMGQSVHPTPTFGSSRIGGGFPTGGVFPSSALSNLDAIKAYVEAEKVNEEKTKSGARTQCQAQAQPKKAEQSAGNTKAAKTAAQPQEQARPEKRDAGTVTGKQEQPEKTVSAVPAKNAEPDKKMLSAGKRDKEPADKESSDQAGNADANNSTKSLSAKNDRDDVKVQEHSKEPAKAEDSKVPTNPATEAKDVKDVKDSGKQEKPETAGTKDEAPFESNSCAETDEQPQNTMGDLDSAQEDDIDDDGLLKGAKAQAYTAAKKIQEKLPPDIADKIPVISTIAKQQKRSLFQSEEKRYLESHEPHKKAIINDLVYDTDNSEMFLRVDGQYGLDNPCVHYNYRTKNGNFFRCTVKYKHEDSIRALDVFEAKRMLEGYPDLYRKYFPDSVSDA